MTTVYLIRHSKCLDVNNDLNDDDFELQNVKRCLSVDGEEIAREKLFKSEFNNIDILFSSNYVRAIQTAKYIALNNNLDINVVSDLGERRFGISSLDELPENFERRQFLDENYKVGGGESQKDVSDRMYKTVMGIISNNREKRIVVVSHATAISYLLKKWCDIKIVDNKLRYCFKNKVLLDGFFNYCESFRLDFDDDTLVNVENIK